MSGRLVTIEGIDGTGKSTLATALARALAERRVPVRLLREPGGVEVSERIRTVVKDPDLAIAPRTEALLYAAARAQLVEEAIRPLIEQGGWVLLDRFVDSSLAYQGAGRGLGVEAIAELNRFATGGLSPDRTLLLCLDGRLARARATARTDTPDRLEREPDEFFGRIAQAYDALAAREPERVRCIDAAAGPAEVLGQALEALRDLLPAAAGTDSAR